MNNYLQTFTSTEFGNVRIVNDNGAVWFVGKDVAVVLGYQNISRDLVRHVDEEDRKKVDLREYRNGTFENNLVSKAWLINESGLYSLILSSKLPAAKSFKRWVTSEVLPAIKKHGGYLTTDKIEQALSDPDTLIKLATTLKEERAARQQAEANLQAAKPKMLFADAVSASDSTILIGDLAKLIKQNGHPIGQKRLFSWMRDNGYLIKRQGADYNSPTQRAMELGLFKIKETAITHADGHVSVSKTTKVTGKGQQYFINKFLFPSSFPSPDGVDVK